MAVHVVGSSRRDDDTSAGAVEENPECPAVDGGRLGRRCRVPTTERCEQGPQLICGAVLVGELRYATEQLPDVQQRRSLDPTGFGFSGLLPGVEEPVRGGRSGQGPEHADVDLCPAI